MRDAGSYLIPICASLAITEPTPLPTGKQMLSKCVDMVHQMEERGCLKGRTGPDRGLKNMCTVAHIALWETAPLARTVREIADSVVLHHEDTARQLKLVVKEVSGRAAFGKEKRKIVTGQAYTSFSAAFEDLKDGKRVLTFEAISNCYSENADPQLVRKVTLVGEKTWVFTIGEKFKPMVSRKHMF